MLKTVDLQAYIRAHENEEGVINLPADDPTMLQAELDGFAIRMDGYWQARGMIQPGEVRTVRHLYGEPGISIIMG